jgi:hypothetical protein
MRIPMPTSHRFFGLSGLQVLTILGVLGATPAIAFPLMTCGPAPLPEGQRTVGMMNRAQQAYLFENNRFAQSVDSLGKAMPTRSRLYDYSTQVTPRTAFNYGIARTPNAYSYVGGVFQIPQNTGSAKSAQDGMTTVAILCVAEQPGPIRPAQPILKQGQPTCAKGTVLSF